MKTLDLFASPLIVTLPGFVRGEAEALCALQGAGAGIIHIRKPGASPQRLLRLLDELRAVGADFTGLTLHGDEAVAHRYGFGGIHIKGDDLLKRRDDVATHPASTAVCGGSVPGSVGGGVSFAGTAPGEAALPAGTAAGTAPGSAGEGVSLVGTSGTGTALVGSACGGGVPRVCGSEASTGEMDGNIAADMTGNRTGDKPATPLRLSCSAHGWEEAARWAPAADYVWLSPLFDSISKAGYHSGIDIARACERLLDGHRNEACDQAELSGQPLAGDSSMREQAFPFPGRIVALGGIAPQNIARVRMAGFGGAAVLGAVWAMERGRNCAADKDARPATAGTLCGEGMSDAESIDLTETLRNFGRLDRRWKAAGGHLQLISDGDMVTAEAFLEGGGRWIQLRMKEASPSQIVARGREMAALCRAYGALLLLNDHPELMAETGAGGVHLGKSDMPPTEARRMLGEGALIGCTANTLEDVLALSTQPADYIGLGPFRYTTTKKNLSPLLGEAGYHRILSALRAQGICLPVVAIGGIGPEDVPALMRTGVNGVALSGAIAHSDAPREATRRFVQGIARWRLGWEEGVESTSG